MVGIIIPLNTAGSLFIILRASSSLSVSTTDIPNSPGNRLKWDTFLKKTDLIGSALEAGIGAKANCVVKNGLGILTEYVPFNRPEGTDVKMTKGPFILKSFAGSWKFIRLDTGITEI